MVKTQKSLKLISSFELQITVYQLSCDLIGWGIEYQDAFLFELGKGKGTLG